MAQARVNKVGGPRMMGGSPSQSEKSRQNFDASDQNYFEGLQMALFGRSHLHHRVYTGFRARYLVYADADR